MWVFFVHLFVDVYGSDATCGTHGLYSIWGILFQTTYEQSLPQSPSGADRRDLVAEMWGDWYFLCPAVNLTQKYAEHGS